RTFLVNASLSHQSRGLPLRFMAPWLDHVYLTNQQDLPWFKQHLPHTTIAYAGDTKYDRVIERTKEHAEQITQFSQHTRQTFGERIILVLGSCWEADLTIFLQAWAHLSSAQKNKFAIIFAPHDTSLSHLQTIESRLNQGRQDVMRFSRWMND